MLDRKIPIPVSEKSYLEFNVDEMQSAYEFYGDEYISKMLNGIDTSNVVIIRKALEITLKECTLSADEVMRRYSLREVASWIVDAIAVSIHGKRVTTSA